MAQEKEGREGGKRRREERQKGGRASAHAAKAHHPPPRPLLRHNSARELSIQHSTAQHLPDICMLRRRVGG